MSTVAAISEEPAAFDGVADDGLEMILPLGQPAQAIKAEFVAPVHDPEENLTPGYVELTNTTHNSLSIVANDYQFLEHESPTSAVDDLPPATDSADNHEHSTSSDIQLSIATEDDQEAGNDDQQGLTNDAVGGQQPSLTDSTVVQQQPSLDNTVVQQQPSLDNTVVQQQPSLDNTVVQQQPSLDSTVVQQQPSNNVADECEQPTTEQNGSGDQPAVENHQPLENQQVAVEPVKPDPCSVRPTYVPPHLMGRDLNNPAQDLIGTNRRVQKPRLGVKVPYRNLTSQIVTQDEIAQELLERQMRKYSYSDVPEGGDVFFAMKLTHRLANKITANENLDKKSPEASKTVASTVANITASDSSAKTDAQVLTETSTSADEVPSTEAQTETSITKVVAKTSDTNVHAETSDTDVPSAVTDGTTSAPAETETTTTTNSVLPAPTEAPQADAKNDSSAVDELYAEISSTLKEEYDPNAMPVQIFSAVQLQAHQSGAKSTSSNVVNGSMTIHNETELDNDTLLAILEGTTDANEPCAAPNVTPPPTPLPQTAIISTPSPVQDGRKRRRKRMKPILDPLLEKELALKQLMAFETKRKERKPKSVTAPKPKAETLPTPQNGVVVAAPKPNFVAVTPAPVSVPRVPATATTDSPKKTKRAPNSYNVGSQAPKRFPKKYQRIIKQQLRTSKKMKTKNQSPEQQSQPQKKLPEVPEVQIAIDRYIKTYASKRKHKPDSEGGEKLVIKKLKTSSGALNVAPAVKVAAAAENVAASNTKAVVAGTKTGIASSKPVAGKAVAAGTKIVPVAEKPAAASVKTAAASGKGSAIAEQAVAASEKAAAASDNAATTIGAIVTAPTGDPLQPPVKSMDVDEPTAAVTENATPPEAEAAAEPVEEHEEAMAKSKANTKMMREINRLLGDEGAINMIYSVEQKRQPGNKRDANAVLPSARRKKKDLQLRTKLVKDAVLRLSMSGSSQGTPSRTVRRSPESPAPAKGASASVAAALRKASGESVESNASELNNNSGACAGTPSRAIKTRQLAAEASRIIRRHSSSSAYSSDEEETPRKTFGADDKGESTTTFLAAESKEETTPDAVVDEKAEAVSSECAPQSAPVKAAVCEKKGAKSNEHSKGKSPASSRRASKEQPTNVQPEESRVQPDVAINGSLSSESFEPQSLKEITVRKYDNLVQIILISSSTKMKNALNIDILHELMGVLRELEKDDSCRTVLVTSTGSSFCQGIDLQSLICADRAERTKIVNEFVNTLMSFTKCLSRFRKILIAGVHGSAVGLGVTMLPFFDMVYASDKATFYTPYVKLGQIPEAGAALTLPHLLGNAVTSELLFGCRMLTASEALQFGLVTRILWPDKFTEELLPLARGVASHSLKAMEATKSLLRQGMTCKLEEQLETEAKLLREHWCSDECQSNFKNYLDQEALLQNA